MHRAVHDLVHHLGPMSHASLPRSADLLRPALLRSGRGDGWDALTDLEMFVFAVEAKLEAMDHERVGVHHIGSTA